MRAALALLLGTAVAGCFGARGPTLAEVQPLERSSARQEPLPDEAERLAARLAALSFAGTDPARVRRELATLRRLEAEDPTRLLDNTLDLYNAAQGPRAYRDYVARALEGGDHDVTLQRKFEVYLESDPLAIAERRLGENRMIRFGQVFNQLASPAASAAIGNPVGAIETGRAAILALLVLSTAPEMTTQQRQALRAYQSFLEQTPEAPEAAEISRRVAGLEARLQEARIEDALELAEKALETRRPDAALLHLDRARRIDPDDPKTQRLTQVATKRQRQREANLLRSLQAAPLDAPSFMAVAGAPGDPLATGVLTAPLAELPELTVQWAEDAPEMGLEDELEFLAAAGRMASGDEDGYFEAMRLHASRNAAETNMGRHALPIATQGNPYASYRTARRLTRRQLASFLFLGRYASGRRSAFQDVPLPLKPLAAVLEIPGVVISVATTPLRLFELSGARARFSGPVLDTGEAYLQKFPEGVHASEVHRDLERRYATRGQWSQALEHHTAAGDPDPGQIAEYRERIAERTLEAARLPRRPDIRAALYDTLVEEYADTRAGRTAAVELAELRKSLTPQAIRISRKFLLENPEVTQPGALGLRPELLDGDDGNGELSKDGVLLIGRTYVRILLEDREPMDADLGTEAFARMISLLEQAYERGLRSDPRARPISDPQRDQFFERARLGLLDEADFRMAAISSFEFLGMNERYGPGRSRDSILPVELAVRGGLADLGLAAVPRIKMPRETEDSILYK